MANVEELKRISSQVRRDIVRMVALSQSGHPGGSLSSADILTALYFNVMKQDPATWTRDGKGQDMFILSAGHLTPVYYSVLGRAGYFPVSELATFRQYGSRLQGHPSIRKGLPGIFQASGSLGQGLSAAAGAALGKKLDKEGNEHTLKAKMPPNVDAVKFILKNRGKGKWADKIETTTTNINISLSARYDEVKELMEKQKEKSSQEQLLKDNIIEAELVKKLESEQ